MCHPLQEVILYSWMYSLWISWWICQQFSLHMGNIAMISPAHAPSSWYSACVSKCAWSSIHVLDRWKYWLHFYFHTKLQWVNQMQNEVPQECFASTHCVVSFTTPLYSDSTNEKNIVCFFLNWPSYGTMCKHEYINWSGLSINGISDPIKYSESN